MNPHKDTLLKTPEGGLRQVFPEGDVHVATDDAELAQYGAELGLKTLLIEDVQGLPPGANVAVFLRNGLVSREVRKTFRGMRALLIPISSFDSSLEIARYTLRMVLETDYEKACEWNRYWARSIAEESGSLVFHSDPAGGADAPVSTRLKCSLATELRANAWLQPPIEPGQWVSIASYAEFSITAPSSSNWHGAFTIEGTAVASGVLVATDARVTDEGAERIERAKRLRDEMAAQGDVTLHLKNSQLVSVTGADGRDFTDAVKETTNPKYEGHVLELGIGTNMALLPHVDWRHNSQLNEGAGPVHLGFGEGITGAHMDFVVADGGHRFE
ncbi:hypothetical protein [Sphaerisporangium dianthi]|uniref:Crocagin biosynthetic protein CgnE/B domain-containing protein n=1 Tax=Sphaerisporangium dianthi TaxID=1436120 RepID=A0ABV9CMH7_9ACTN